MGLADDLKNKAHDAIKHQETRQKIEAIAREDGVSFNEAMKRFFSRK